MTRLTSKAYSLGNEGNLGNVAYSYLDHETDEGRTTGVVGSISYFGAGTDLSLGTRYYDYDNQGNVIREYRYSKDETGLRESYEYDSKNQLVRHDSKTQNKTFTYSYDKAGNILSKTTYNYTTSETLGTPIDTVSYQYQSNDGWGDKLTSYDGKAITYDEIGNMTSFDGKTYSWQGRELTGITTAIDTYSYKYNAEGIRTEKIVNGITTKYFLNGSQVVAETTDGNTIWFIYDSQGSRVALVENGQTFYYMYNLQGDVIGLVDETTGEVVATYEYDAWGRCILVQNKEGYTVGTDNPFRYMGYYYDEETGFYYLNSRYYSPEFGRFINADTTDVLGVQSNLYDKNLYAYCDNNPVSRRDATGEFWDYALDVGFLAWSVSDVINDPGNWKNWAALAIDTAFAVIPFVPSGVGQVIKSGNKIDNAMDVANGIKKTATITKTSKTTMIGRNMNRVTETAKIIGVSDNLYKTWNGYEKVSGVSKVLANSISATHNGTWLYGKLRKGYTVIDIGVSTAHKSRGLWYGTERVVLGTWRTRNIWKLPINYYLN